VVRLLSQQTAQLSGLESRKGSLAPGYDADLVVWDPEREFEVSVKSDSIFRTERSSILHCIHFFFFSQIKEASIQHKNKVSHIN